MPHRGDIVQEFTICHHTTYYSLISNARRSSCEYIQGPHIIHLFTEKHIGGIQPAF